MAIFPFPSRGIAAVSVAASYFLVSFQSSWKLGFVSSFFYLWMLQTLAYVLWTVILWPKLFSPLRDLPEPPGGSFLNGHFATIQALPTGIPMRNWIATVPNDGIIRYRGLANSERVLVSGSKALAEVLVTKNYHFEKPALMRRSLGRMVGVGVLVAEGEEHRIQRKNLMPAFAFRHTKDLYPTFWRKTREVVQAMTKHILADAEKQPASSDAEKSGKMAVIEVTNWASRVTLDIIGVAGLGRDFSAIKDENTELNETYRRLFAPNAQAHLLDLLGEFVPAWVISSLPVKRNTDINDAAQYVRSVCMSLIQEKKQKMVRKEAVDHDILSVALESGGFTDEELVNQLMTFLAAGHETTASAMTWAVYALARYPAVQERLRTEIRENLQPIDVETDITSFDIDRLPYLNAVCNELLRYHSPVPITFREAAQNTEILGHKIPKGVKIVLAPWATNFDKELWGADAHEFNPDRWMPTGSDEKRAASGGATSNYALLTFLHGPRSCIGQAFARAEFACILAGWAGRFAFELDDPKLLDEKNLEIKASVTARPSKGLRVRTTVVDGW